MRYLIMISFFSFIYCSIYSQHNDIIFDVPTDVFIEIQKGDYYWIDLKKFEVNGLNYNYGKYIDVAGDKRYYKNFDAGIILLEGTSNIFPLQSSYGRFEGISGSYRIIFNIDITHPSVNVEGELTLINLTTHLNRNKYNKVAKGTLIRKSGSIFTDENGCEWELQNQCFNAFHNPQKNAKFLHKVSGGGEYETIREILPNEGKIDLFICPDSDIIPVKTMKVVVVKSDTLKGNNVLNTKYQSSYNFGHTGFTSFFKHKHLDMSPHESNIWGGNYFPTLSNSYMPKCKVDISSTLFLFDLSGSMNENGANSSTSKLNQAKSASKQTLNSIKNDQSGVTNEVAVLGFAGGCVADPTIPISGFETKLSLVETRIDAMRAGGGTPLAEAIAAAECKLANHLSQNNQEKGKLIILSDGVATCQKIRPNGVYNSAPLQQTQRTISASQCGGGSGTLPNKIKYYTIGFNIAPGTPAERDLQYLAQISGGKYLNVQNQVQLERAFRKFNRTYVPKENPALMNLSPNTNSNFGRGVSKIKSEEFASALKMWEDFVKQNKGDCHGIYNLALMQEANDFYKKAIENYKKYLSICPNPSDKVFVEKQIRFLEEEFKQFLLFQKEVLKSDLEYLNLHFQKIQNGQSIALAEEFKGFIKEKGDYYINLPELVGRTEKLFKRNAKEVAEGLNKCAKLIQRNPQKWDRDATPFLSMTYLNLERLIECF